MDLNVLLDQAPQVFVSCILTEVILLHTTAHSLQLCSSIFHISQHPAFVDTRQAQKMLNDEYAEY